MTYFRIERDNPFNISELMKTGEKPQASHRFLQIANRHAEMIPLLDHIINVKEDDVPEHLKTVIYRILQEARNPFLRMVWSSAMTMRCFVSISEHRGLNQHAARHRRTTPGLLQRQHA